MSIKLIFLMLKFLGMLWISNVKNHAKPEGEEKRAPENCLSRTHRQTNAEKPSMLVL